MIAHASVPRNPPAAPITFSTSVRDAWCVKHYRAIGRPKADNRSRYTRIDPLIFAVFTVCRANAVWKFVACGLQRCSNSLRGYVKRKRSTGIFVGSFVRWKEERANREKGTSIRNGVSFVHGEIRAEEDEEERGVGCVATSLFLFALSRSDKVDEAMAISMHGGEITSSNECKVMSGVIPMLRQASRRLNAPVQRTD